MSSEAADAAEDAAALEELNSQLLDFNWKEGVVDRAKKLLFSTIVDDNIKGVASLKAMLCIGRDEVYAVAQEVIDNGAIPQLTKFLCSTNRSLQLPAAFCLTNIAAGHDEQTEIVVKSGAVDPLIAMLRSDDPHLRRQSIFCLANVAGSTPDCRVTLARHPDFFAALCKAGDETDDIKVLELVCWNLRNVCLLGGPAFEDITRGVTFLITMIGRLCGTKERILPSLSGCVRFGFETFTFTCRSHDGRVFLQSQNCAVESWLAHLTIETLAGMMCSPEAQSLLEWRNSSLCVEILAWLLTYGSLNSRKSFVASEQLIRGLLMFMSWEGFGGQVEEFNYASLHCFGAIAAAGVGALSHALVDDTIQAHSDDVHCFVHILSTHSNFVSTMHTKFVHLLSRKEQESRQHIFICGLVIAATTFVSVTGASEAARSAVIDHAPTIIADLIALASAATSFVRSGEDMITSPALPVFPRLPQLSVAIAVRAIASLMRWKTDASPETPFNPKMIQILAESNGGMSLQLLLNEGLLTDEESFRMASELVAGIPKT